MAFVLGQDGKLYFNDGGTYGSPTWTELNKVKDVSLNLTKETADSTVRSSGGFREYVDGLKDVNVSFKMLWDNAADGYDELLAAYENNTAVEILCVDGATPPPSGESIKGVRMTTMVANFTRDETLGEVMWADVELRPVSNANSAPAIYTESTP
jgi:hypothetical protein